MLEIIQQFFFILIAADPKLNQVNESPNFADVIACEARHPNPMTFKVNVTEPNYSLRLWK